MKFTQLSCLVLTGAGLSGGFIAKSGKFPGHDRPTAEWPEFRGPSQDGHSNAIGLPTEWVVEKNVAWKTVLPGRAWSSPIVADGRIYLTNSIATDDNNDGNFLNDRSSLRVLALDAADGRVIWDSEVFNVELPHSSGVHDKNSHASPTPVYENGRIYAHFGHFGTACLDEAGNLIWKTNELAYKPEHGNGSCPVIVDDLLIFNGDASQDPFVAALDKATGKLRWKKLRNKKTRNTYSFSTPLVIEVNGEKQLISPGSSVMNALNPKDGHEIWRVYYDGYSVVPRPVFAHGLVFISTGFDQPSALAIKPDGQGNVTDTHIVWEVKKGVPLTPSMLVIGDELYMASDNGIVSCLDAKTGQVIWSERVGKTTSASLLYADGKIYMQDEFGKGYVIKPGKQFELLATNDLGDKSLASYAVHRNRLLIRTQHALWCIGGNKS